jgi:hypothetical protein
MDQDSELSEKKENNRKEEMTILQKLMDGHPRSIQIEVKYSLLIQKSIGTSS